MSHDSVVEAERIIRHHRRRRALLVFVVALVVAAIMSWLGVWTWPAHAAESPSASMQVTTEAAGGSCQQWAAGWVSVPAPCNPAPLPAWVKRVIGGAATGCVVGLLAGGNVPVGCLGGALGTVNWGD